MTEKHEDKQEERQKKLRPDQYRILREAGTEPPFSSPLNNEKRHGVYRCAGCGETLFSSESKFDSGSGWPSFWAPFEQDRVTTREDRSHGMERVEVLCARCDGHLGHVFEDGPPPTNLRYCINGGALEFQETASGEG